MLRSAFLGPITDHQNHDLPIADRTMAGEWESSISLIYNLDSRQAPISVPIDFLFFLFGSRVTETCRSKRSSKPLQNVNFIYNTEMCQSAYCCIYGTEMCLSAYWAMQADERSNETERSNASFATITVTVWKPGSVAQCFRPENSCCHWQVPIWRKKRSCTSNLGQVISFFDRSFWGFSNQAIFSQYRPIMIDIQSIGASLIVRDSYYSKTDVRGVHLSLPMVQVTKRPIHMV